MATPSPAFHPALRDLTVLSSILQPSISIFVTPIPPLHPQTTQAFHPTWSSPILPAPISASHPAVSDPNFSLFPGPALANPPSFSPALPLLLQFGSPGRGGPPCQLRSWWGLSIRGPGPGAGDSLRVPGSPSGKPAPSTRASRGTSAMVVFMSHPTAHSCPSPGRACLLQVTASLDSWGPASHWSGWSQASHAHTPPTKGGAKERGPRKVW